MHKTKAETDNAHAQLYHIEAIHRLIGSVGWSGAAAGCGEPDFGAIVLAICRSVR
jgi:hypothetical protein